MMIPNEKNRKQIVLICMLASFLLSSAACNNTVLRETYYVGVVNDNKDAFQLYRFKVYGASGWTKTKYASGWYSAEALETMLGGNFKDLTQGQKEEGCKSEGQRYYITGPEGRMRCVDDKRLAIIMSSDPKPITDAINSLVKEKAIENLFKSVMSKKDKETDKENLCEKHKDKINEIPDENLKKQIKTLCQTLSLLKN